MNLEALPWKDMTTIALAALGAGLGVMNTWNALSQRRVRLVVRPTYAIDPRTPKDPPARPLTLVSGSNHLVARGGPRDTFEAVGRLPRQSGTFFVTSCCHKYKLL
jgi:hypothetical protein